MRLLSLPRLLAALVLLTSPPLAAPLLAADGHQLMNFGAGDGVATWPTNTDTGTLSGVTATDQLLIGIGSHKIGGSGSSHLMWQAVDVNGELLGVHHCDQHSNTLFGALAASSDARAGVVDSSGNLLVAGQVTYSSDSQMRPLLARFDLGVSGCVLDTGFATIGWEFFAPTACSSANCTFVALAPVSPLTGAVSAGSDRTIGLLRVTVNLLVARFFLVSIEPDGGLDTDFGTSGYAEVTASGLGQLGSPAALAVDGRGRIYVLVTRYDPAGGGVDLDTYLLRFTTTGDLDTSLSLGLGRVAVEDVGSGDATSSSAGALAIASDGDPIASLVRGDNVELWTYDPATGGSYGNLYTQGVQPWELMAQGDERVVTAVDDEADVVLGRRWLTGFTPPDFEPDPEWSVQFYDLDLGGSNSQSTAGAILWHGRPVLGGTAASDAGNRAFLIELENDYVFAARLEQGTLAGWSAAFDFE